MATADGKQFRIGWHEVSILERFSSVLYPIDIMELLRLLPTIEYLVPALVLRGTPEIGKPIATKGDAELVLNQENKTIGIRGRDIATAVKWFTELRKFYMEKLDPSPGLETQYVEINCEGWAKSGTSPNASFASFWSNCHELEELGAIVGKDAVNYGIQLAPANTDPNRPDWFHFYIEPLIVSSDKRYRVKCIWRESQAEPALTKFVGIEGLVEKMIRKIEGH
ncbi:MAG: hypothetical protein HYX90_00550 [Chloroflexi bacterium]|nr:hypothetical protein [Chloroflexota bacterium]